MPMVPVELHKAQQHGRVGVRKRNNKKHKKNGEGVQDVFSQATGWVENDARK